MGAVNTQPQQFNEDGTPRRKYEPDELPESKAINRATIGLVLFNAFVLLKNILFDGNQSSAHHANNAQREQARPAIEDLKENVDFGSPLSDEMGDDEESGFTAKKVGSGTLINGQPVGHFDDTSAPMRGVSGLASGNDNDALYGAAPGEGIALFSSDGDQILTRGGSGRTSPASGQLNDIDDADEDDDGDNDTPNDLPPRPVNRLPVVAAPVLLASIVANAVTVIESENLLRHASDPDGDDLSVRNLQSSSGSLVQQAHGRWIFTPDRDDTSGVILTYQISDGEGTTPQTASFDILPQTTVITGTPGDDTLVGTPAADAISGLDGHDLIIGREGDDILYGGDGNDRIIAGDGNDVVHAGAGDDVVFAGAGNDVIFGDNGHDLLFGDTGDDEIFGNAGNDTAWGGHGADLIIGGTGNDVLRGDDGNDVIEGGNGSDEIMGGAGSDIVLAGLDADIVYLDDGDDRVIAENGDGDDQYFGGNGFDTYDTSGTVADAFIDLAGGGANSTDIGKDSIAGVENVRAGSGSDKVFGNSDANVIEVELGNDVVFAAAGNDILLGGDGNDALFGEDGDDRVLGGSGSDTIVGGDGADTLQGDAGNDLVVGGSGADAIVGGDGNDIIEAGFDDDAAAGNDGEDIFIGHAGDGDDVYDGGGGADTYNISSTSANALIDLLEEEASSLEVGDDLIANFEHVHAGRGNDVIVASDATNVIIGGGGDDTFVFRSTTSIGHGPGHRDRILDFSVGDRIDLEDVREEFAEDLDETFEDQNIQRFVLIRDQDEFARPGEMKLRYESFEGKDVTIIEGNTDFDAESEFELEVAGTYSFTGNDFHRTI